MNFNNISTGFNNSQMLSLTNQANLSEGCVSTLYSEGAQHEVIKTDLNDSNNTALITSPSERKKSDELKKIENERKLLCTFLNTLNISDSDLSLSLSEYILSECLKIFQKQESIDPNAHHTLIALALQLHYGLNTDGLVLFVDTIFEKMDCPEMKLKLRLIVKNGKSVLDKPLYEILNREFRTNEPRENILNSMRVCLGLVPSMVNLFNNFLVSVNGHVNILQKFIKNNNNVLNSHSVDGFDQNSFKEFHKVRTIQSDFQKNFQIIDDFIRPSISVSSHSINHPSQVVNDFLYLKYKYKKSIFNCLKELVTKIENTQEILERADKNVAKFNQSILASRNKSLQKGLIILPKDADIKEHSERFDGAKQHCLFLKTSFETFNSKYSELCKQYEAISNVRSDADVNRDLTWLMFGDEMNEAKGTQKLNIDKPTKNKNTNTSNIINNNNQIRKAKGNNKRAQVSRANEKTQAKQINSKNELQPATSIFSNAMPSQLSQKELLSGHSTFIYALSQMIKEDLRLKCKDSQLDGGNYEKAKIHSKELRDHLQYASLNFDLFCKAIQSQDLYAIGAIVPFLFMDQHLAIEQMIKYRTVMEKMVPCNSHNLSELFSNSPCMIHIDQKSFVEDFSDAMLQVRYPVSWAHKVQNGKLPGPLKWMQFSQELCDKINSANSNPDTLVDPVDPEKLMKLCNFVFDSYTNILQCLIQELNPNSELQQCSIKNVEYIDALKGILETSIKNKPGQILAAAMEIKKTRPVSKDANSILQTRKSLLGVGQGIISGIKNEEAISTRVLEEASNHLGRIDAVDYLQSNYGDLRFAALHHRNLLMFQWIYEQLYRFNGYVAGKGEMSWICNHNLELFHAFVFPNESSKTLADFNFIRNVHYTHENGIGKSLPMMKELLETRKFLKKIDSEDWLKSNSKKSVAANIEDHKKTVKENRLQILKKGKAQLESILHLTKAAEL